MIAKFFLLTIFSFMLNNVFAFRMNRTKYQLINNFGKNSYYFYLKNLISTPTLNSGGHMKDLVNESVVSAPVSCLSMSCLCMRMTF